MEKENQKSAPTGCFKCGRPGHWSRDCPSSAPNPTNLSSSSSSLSKNPQNSFRSSAADGKPSAAKPKKAVAPRTRPKLTAELLLSEDGLGYVLRHFPRNFKHRGRGHEVSDLGNLISMYSEWHSRLLPYYSFDQFVHKVDQVAATKRVKLCLRELRERVAAGGDPTKLHEPPSTAEDIPQGGQAAMNSEEVGLHQEAPSSADQNVYSIQEDMLQDVFDSAIEIPSGKVNDAAVAIELPKETPNRSVSDAGENDVTEEQKARMEANRLKALEKAAARARARALQVT